MTNEEIRIKVAESLGAKKYERPFDKKVFLCATQPIGTRAWPVTDRPVDVVLNDVPNYPESLDACAEFEKTLTDEEHLRYRVQLWNVVITESDETTWDRQFISTAASQRCIAYLKTKGILP